MLRVYPHQQMQIRLLHRSARCAVCCKVAMATRALRKTFTAAYKAIRQVVVRAPVKFTSSSEGFASEGTRTPHTSTANACE
eukprot:3461253-Amphidinium_carterae.1